MLFDGSKSKEFKIVAMRFSDLLVFNLHTKTLNCITSSIFFYFLDPTMCNL